MTLDGKPLDASSTASATPDVRQDPAMKALYRMSRTAGVGLQDYAAVNVPSVVGLLLGIASFLAVAWADSVAVLVFPVAAAIISLIAIVQIRRSNGTQTGQLLAIAGLVLAIVFAGINIAGHARTAARENAYHAELTTLASKLLSGATTQGSDQAYQLFDDRFQDSVKLESFQRILQPRMNYYFAKKPITSVTISDLVVYETDENGVTTATTLLIFRGDGKMPDGGAPVLADPVEFRRTPDGVWKIHSLANWFGQLKKTDQPG